MIDRIVDSLQTFATQFRDLLSNFDPITDILDILLVAFIIYCVFMQLRKSQSIQVIKGFILLAVIYIVATVIGLKTTSYIFSNMFGNFILFLFIIFNYEIRQTLENAGKGGFSGRVLFSSNNDNEITDCINAVCRACAKMSDTKTGSLIIFQRESLLGDLLKQSVPIDSVTTYEMLCGIFYPNTPLHDGAIVIKDGRIVAARCIVPLKNDYEINAHVGTRHRAALNVSINFDAVAVVTSEETGMISVAVDGQMRRGLSDAELRELLNSLLLKNDTPKKRFFANFRRGDKKNG
ncbi:MAG: diadenylate cyclase CdaA [Clostridia bacterium]|nr:diadenylate cyclase CdaA [Clostridia bacterium]